MLKFAPRALALLFPLFSAADEYPQWLGPQRDGIYREKNVLTTFPATGPKVLWRAPIAAGYSGPAVAPGKVIVTDHILKQGVPQPANPFARASLPGVERILCFNDSTGRQLWKVEYDCPYTISYAAGPRTTPLIDGERVYTLGAEGHVYCIDLRSGDVIWNKKLEGNPPVWGFSGSPIINGDRLILLGSGHPLLLALNKNTGQPIWSALEAKEPGYSPPMIHTINGQRQLVQWYPDGLVGLDPQTGKQLWFLPYGPAQVGVTITTPLFIHGDTVIVSTQYEGSAAVQVRDNQPKLLWHAANKGRAINTLHTLHAPMVYHDGHVFGVHNTGELLCIDPADGHVIWKDEHAILGDADPIRWTAAFITPWQPDQDSPAKYFFIATEKGDLIICNLSAKGCTEISRAHLLNPTNADAQRLVLWTHPAYAHQSVYWRNDKELIRASLAVP